MSETFTHKVRQGVAEAAPANRKRQPVAVRIAPAQLCADFGVDDPGVASRLLAQILSFVDAHAADEPVEASTINYALELVRGIAPRGVQEALTAVLLVATQQAAADAMRRALHPDQTPGGRSMYLTMGVKATRTFAGLIEALNHGRGRGVVKQEITVVRVEAGAQAIVGDVARGRG